MQSLRKNVASGVMVAVFIIPIAFSFIYGGAVLSMALQNPERSFGFPEMQQTSSIQIIQLQNEYSSSDAVSAQVSVSDPEYSCGDLYMTIYDVSSSPRKAVKQGAFFDQCYETDGILPTNDKFSEKVASAGSYVLEVQLFDQNGDNFLTASQKFTVR